VPDAAERYWDDANALYGIILQHDKEIEYSVPSVTRTRSTGTGRIRTG
jgi:hypothetical protein